MRSWGITSFPRAGRRWGSAGRKKKMHEYPTDASLKVIQKWDFSKKGVDGFLDFIERFWHWPDWGFVRSGNRLELYTGGWSSNEDIIEAMKVTLFWSACWKKSERGGRYFFELDDFFEMGAGASVAKKEKPCAIINPAS